MRLRSKSCLGNDARCVARWEKVASDGEVAKASAGDCGDEDQVGRADSIPPCPALRGANGGCGPAELGRFTWR